jgi:hypothetical protein
VQNWWGAPGGSALSFELVSAISLAVTGPSRFTPAIEIQPIMAERQYEPGL